VTLKKAQFPVCFSYVIMLIKKECFQVRIIVREERKGNLLQKEIFIRSCDRYLAILTTLYNTV
jgi:hypothetical protein